MALVRLGSLAVRAAMGWKIGLALAVAALPLLMFFGFLMAAGSAVGGGKEPICSVQGVAGGKIPANYVPWLEKGARKYKLGPKGFAIVAAIHYVESDFGRSPLPGVKSGTNFAGAAGPGQFLLEYWPSFGVDGDEDGDKDIYSIPDSVMATARHQHVNGAPQNWHDAIFAYNHAEWYVEKVLKKAEEFGGTLRQVCDAAELTLEGVAESVTRIEEVAIWMESREFHYCWGGGHGLVAGPSTGSGTYCPPGLKGLDCSGAVRWLLKLSGFPDKGPMVSGDFPYAYQAGRGEHVTIWGNASHVFIEINGRTWGTSESNPFNGPGFAPHSTAGFMASHPTGL